MSKDDVSRLVENIIKASLEHGEPEKMPALVALSFGPSVSAKDVISKRR